MKRVAMAALGGFAMVMVANVVWVRPLSRATLPARVAVAPFQLMADGYDSATLTIDEKVPGAPAIEVRPAHAATVQDVWAADGVWRARIRAGVTPGVVEVWVRIPERPAGLARLVTELDERDSVGDGTPDFLRLEDADDQRAFRRWFTFLAEAQYFEAAERRAAEIVDCAALIRYAYREALRLHDGNWATGAHLPIVPGIPSAVKYQYPYTPLGAGLFRVTPGPFRPADLTGGAFAQFADAKTLQVRNTYFVTRDVTRAQSGDLLFYRHDGGDMPFHSMIYLGESQIEKGTGRYLVYHTGPEGAGRGEIRRPSLDELRHFPEPDWRPLADNPRFLGVYRWNILRQTS